MRLKLYKISVDDKELLWKLQKNAFKDLLEKYKDFSTNPGAESLKRIEEKLKQEHTYFYFIYLDSIIIGAIRVVDFKNGTSKRIAPIFILREFRNKRFAQQAIKEVEKIHGENNWRLDTIFQEKANCYLYEKLGYKQVGSIEKINDKLDIICYEKQ